MKNMNVKKTALALALMVGGLVDIPEVYAEKSNSESFLNMEITAGKIFSEKLIEQNEAFYQDLLYKSIADTNKKLLQKKWTLLDQESSMPDLNKKSKNMAKNLSQAAKTQFKLNAKLNATKAAKSFL